MTDQTPDNSNYDAVAALTRAVGAVSKAAQRALTTETYDGAGEALVGNYHALQQKIAETLPDDYYAGTVLQLTVPEDADDRQVVSLVQLAASQMHTYLRSLLEDMEDGPGSPPWGGPPGTPPWGGRRRRNRQHPRDFGRELSEEILDFTKETLRRALSQVDIDVPEPPQPPTPPEPPQPPQKKKRVEVDDDPDEDDDRYI
ncbi:MAG: hypothetical protein AAFV33_08860 [Chloroflexota bacterium]